MGQTLTDKSCREFLDALGARIPVPGGGGTAALVGALSAALCSMVANYTIGKKSYVSVEDDMYRVVSEVSKLKEQLLLLVDQDALAFEALSSAYKASKSTKSDVDGDKALEMAIKTAADIPAEMMRQLCRIIELLEEMSYKGTQSLLSDIGCGAYLASSALQAAAITVFVNTKEYRDHRWAKLLEADCDAMLHRYVPRAQAVADKISAKIRNGNR